MDLAGLAEKYLLSDFYASVSAYPASPAIIDGSCITSYRALSTFAALWQGAFVQCGIQPSERILIRLRSKTQVVAAMLASLAQGAIYVVIDPEMPIARLYQIAADADTLWCASEEGEDIPGLKSVVPLKMVDSSALSTVGFSSHHLAYLAYTSGSTGRPKAVMHTRGNISYEIKEHRETLGLRSSDRFSGLYPLGTTGAVRDVFAALLNGAAYVPFDLRQGRLEELTQWVLEKGITVFHSVPAIFRSWVNSLDQQSFPDVRVVFLAGDQVRPSDVALSRRYFPNAIFYTGLGATEASSLYVHWIVPRDFPLSGSVLPCGFPVSGKTISIVDPENAGAVSKGEIGEIMVRGADLSPGYWQRPELTEKSFHGSANDRIWKSGDLGYFDDQGRLNHAGRLDRQIKINGVRIEPGEVENALYRTGLVADSLVVPHRREGVAPALIAYVVLRSDVDASVGKLRSMIAEALPETHLPRFFVELEKFPLKGIGKVDESALPSPFPDDLTESIPQSAEQKAVKEIFREVLKIYRIPLEASFFDLGGDSLGFLELVSMLQKRLGISWPVNASRSSLNVKNISALLGTTSCGADWNEQIKAHAASWRIPDGAARSGFFPGYILGRASSERPLVLWLAQNKDQHLPAAFATTHEIWAIPSGNGIVPTDDGSIKKILSTLVLALKPALEGRPLIIAGACGSGTIAVAAAGEFERAGIAVEKVVAIEALGHAKAYNRFVIGQLGWLRLFKNVRRTPVFSAKLLGLLSTQIRNFRARLSPSQRFSRPLESGGHPFALQEIKPWDGKLQLVVTRCTWIMSFLHGGLGWSRRIYPNLEIRFISGNHLNFYSAPPEKLLSDLHRP